MGQFNISGSKIEQVNDSGNNYKQVGGSGNNSLTENGNIVNSDGDNNRIQVDRPKESLGSAILGKLTLAWKWGIGYFGRL